MTASLLSVRAGLAIAAGSLAEARGLAERALAIGRRVDPGEAWAIAVLQLGTVSVFEERASEVGADVRTGIVSHPHTGLFQVGAISLLCQTGAEEEARRRLLALARDRYQGLPRDLSFGLSLSGLATSCARLGCAEAAEPLYELLLPYAGRTLTLLCHYSGGCASRYLGVLSALLGRWDEAARHFELAIGVDGAAGALAWQAYAVLDYARSLLARGLARDAARARGLLDGALAAAQGLRIPALEREAAEALTRGR
jgi:tetratricopeptide (TPR) repeat protein